MELVKALEAKELTRIKREHYLEGLYTIKMSDIIEEINRQMTRGFSTFKCKLNFPFENYKVLEITPFERGVFWSRVIDLLISKGYTVTLKKKYGKHCYTIYDIAKSTLELALPSEDYLLISWE